MPLMAAFFRLRLVPSILLSVAGTCLLLHAVPTSCCSSMCNVAAAAGAAAAGGAATCADDGVAAAAAALCSQCIAAGAVPATLPAQLQALQRQQGRHAADAASIPSLVAHAMDVFALEWLGLPSVMLQRRATLRDGHDALAVCKAVGHTLQVSAVAATMAAGCMRVCCFGACLIAQTLCMLVAGLAAPRPSLTLSGTGTVWGTLL